MSLHPRGIRSLCRISRPISTTILPRPRVCGVHLKLRPERLTFATPWSRRHFHTTRVSCSIIKSPLPDLTGIPQDLSLTHFMISDFKQHANKTALIDGPTGRKLTYAELNDQVASVGSALVRRGIGKGDVVTLFAGNSPEFIVTYLAIVGIGAVASAVNPYYTVGELNHAVNFGEAKLIIADQELIPIVNGTLEALQKKLDIIVIGEAAGCEPLSNLYGESREDFPDNPDINPMDDLSVLPFSSGTTGLPKAVMLTHYNLIVNVEQIRGPSLLAYSPSDVFLGLMPFYHIYGQTVIMLCVLKSGGTMITWPKFEPERFLNCIQEHRVSFLHVAPPLVVFLAKHPLVDKYDMSSVQFGISAGAPIGGNVIEEALHKMKIPDAKIGQVYGLTESSPVTHGIPRSTVDTKAPAIGLPVPSTHMKVLDIETGKTLGPNQEGELCVIGPNIMKGYLKNQEATDKTVIDGWLHTGDLAYYDEDGFTFITDRLKELIKVKGFQVAPAELEAVLLHHPAVQDSAVIGVPDERAGELPRAYVVLKEGKKVSAEDIQQFVKDQVAPFKQLAGGVEFRDSVPKSSSGKILRRHLRDEWKQQSQ